MKPIIVIFICSFSLTSFAQDYLWLGGDDQRYYRREDSIVLEMIPIFQTTIVGDSVFRLAGIYNPNTTLSSDCTLPNWMGNYWIKQAEWDLFVNANDDTIQIKRNAIINESWLFYSDSTSNYIQATVTAITLSSVWNVQDSLKEIQLQFKDSIGNIINHPINNQIILLSKANGIIKFFDFNLFPVEIKEIKQFDPYNPFFQTYEMGDAEIYNYEIGDEVHTLYRSLFGPDRSYNYRIESIIDKTVFPDSIIYTIASCYRSAWYYWSDSTVSTGKDTHTIMVDFIVSPSAFKSGVFSPPSSLNFFAYDTLYLLSEGDVPATSMLEKNTTDYNNRKIRHHYAGWYQYNSSDDCYSEVIVGGVFVSRWYYIEGIGGAYFSSLGGGSYSYSFFPLYFKKGNEEWGNPLQCNLLLGVGENKSKNIQFSVLPNPTSKQLFIDLPQLTREKYKLKIYNILGELVSVTTLVSNHQAINVADLEAGKYLIAIEKAGELVGVNSFIKLNLE